LYISLYQLCPNIPYLNKTEIILITTDLDFKLVFAAEFCEENISENNSSLLHVWF